MWGAATIPAIPHSTILSSPTDTLAIPHSTILSSPTDTLAIPHSTILSSPAIPHSTILSLLDMTAEQILIPRIAAVHSRKTNHRMTYGIPTLFPSLWKDRIFQ